MPEIRLEGITKRFGDFTAVHDLNLVFEENTVTCLLGPSGCGKTTLMRMIAGLETPTSGRIRFGNRDVTELAPRRRNIGMVFQYPVMYPTLTVAENILLPLRRDRGVSPAERQRRLAEVLDILQMTDRADARIGELDGGSRQKVAVGRAVARYCDIILFDEPTTTVEVNAKLQLIRAFKDVARRLQQTIVYVTHDQTEAMTLADHIALMRDGRIAQFAPPRALYAQCRTEFGGWFIGNPGMNFYRTGLTPTEHGLELPFCRDTIAVPDAMRNQDLTVGIRPEHVRLHASPRPDTVEAVVLSRTITIGGQYLVKLMVGEHVVRAKVTPEIGRDLGAQVHMACRARDMALFHDGQRVMDTGATDTEADRQATHVGESG